MAKQVKKKTSFRLTDEAARLLDRLASKFFQGNKTTSLEMVIREAAERRGIA